MLNIGLPYETIDQKILVVAEKHEFNPEALLEILQDLQQKYGGLSQETVQDVARALRIPAQRAFGVATFYSLLSTQPGPARVMRVCDGPACWLVGAAKIQAAAEDHLGVDWVVERTSCLGLCDHAPAALVDDRWQVGPLTDELLSKPDKGWETALHRYTSPLPGEIRVLLAQAGEIDPLSIDSALNHRAYQGLKLALQRSPDEVIGEVELSAVKGRGGAGFPAGQKWRLVAQQSRMPKYIVCNADESEPLVFKDRVLIDNNPHLIIEGMAIAAYAVGAQEGFIYIRGEYPAQAQLLAQAIQQAETRGYLGNRILNTGFSFHIHVHRGAGAYICGEETALLESLEGKRGEPRIRPPYPTVHGYHGMPTVVNNVETFATIPPILASGAEWYRSLGNPDTPGTKLYTLLGHVNRPGLFEAPYNLTLRKIIVQFGGGMKPGSRFNFALTGGAAGTLVPPALLDIPINYQSAGVGVSLGAGALLICDQSVSPVALLRELLHFFEMESCGKCTPCRVGTAQARQILDRLVARDVQPRDLDALTGLAEVLGKDSLCGLGQSVSWPINSALGHFREAFINAKVQRC